jgi:transposase
MQISNLIELPESEVRSISKNEHGHLFITVETTETSVPCRVCKKEINRRHACDKERILRHLPVFGKQAYIIYKPHRYICDACDDSPTTTATAIWHKPNSTYTIDYENHVLGPVTK